MQSVLAHHLFVGQVASQEALHSHGRLGAQLVDQTSDAADSHHAAVVALNSGRCLRACCEVEAKDQRESSCFEPSLYFHRSSMLRVPLLILSQLL